MQKKEEEMSLENYFFVERKYNASESSCERLEPGNTVVLLLLIIASTQCVHHSDISIPNVHLDSVVDMVWLHPRAARFLGPPKCGEGFKKKLEWGGPPPHLDAQMLADLHWLPKGLPSWGVTRLEPDQTRCTGDRKIELKERALRKKRQLWP